MRTYRNLCYTDVALTSERGINQHNSFGYKFQCHIYPLPPPRFPMLTYGWCSKQLLVSF